DAKSAYGAIVYSKAPGVLKQLAFVLGDAPFRDGLRLYLKEHAYGNAEWSDLVGAFERTSGQKLGRWAEMWIKHRGMPQVDVSWSCEGRALNHIKTFDLVQHDVLNNGGIWPIAMEVLLVYAKREPLHFRVSLDEAERSVDDLIGKPCPSYLFANSSDYAYGRFLLDPQSRNVVLWHMRDVHEPFDRGLL